MNHAHSQLHLKAIDGEQRIIRGIATTPETDRQGDVVEPLGAVLRMPTPLLLHHDHRLVVGQVTSAKATAAGIEFEAVLPKIDDPGPLRDRVNEAWGLIKSGLTRGVSIGFRALADGVEAIKGGIRYRRWELLELSLVAVPANASASIHSIKGFDHQHAGLPVMLIPTPRPPVRLIPRERV